VALTIRPDTAKALALAWGFGWRIAAGLVLGYYLDVWMGTSPLWLFVVTMGSFVASVTEFIRLSQSSRRDIDSGDDSHSPR
jgi:F0F1-type ATP synthase assembly protein I